MSEAYTDDDFREEPRQIQDLARFIRNEYLALKQGAMRNAGYKVPPRQDNMGHYVRAARLCLELNTRPSDLLKACFTIWNNPAGPPTNAIGGKAAKSCWMQYAQTRKLPTLNDPLVPERDDSVPKGAFDASASDHEQWEDAWSLVALHLRLPKADEQTPGLLALCQDATSHLPFWFRVVLFPNDPTIWSMFSYPAVKSLNLNNPLKRHLQMLKPNAIAILDSKPPAPKHEWMKYDTAFDS